MLARARWAEVQETFFASAYSMARAGREALNKGQSDEAAKMLTQYMRENVDKVLDVAGELALEFRQEPVGVAGT